MSSRFLNNPFILVWKNTARIGEGAGVVEGRGSVQKRRRRGCSLVWESFLHLRRDHVSGTPSPRQGTSSLRSCQRKQNHNLPSHRVRCVLLQAVMVPFETSSAGIFYCKLFWTWSSFINLAIASIRLFYIYILWHWYILPMTIIRRGYSHKIWKRN